MLELFLSLALAALPAALLIFFFYRKDRARPEPLGLIGKSVLYGFLAVIPAIVLELLLDRFRPRFRGVFDIFIEAFIVAALVEEAVKLFFVRRYLWKRPEFDEAADGIVYAACVSLGFAFVENFLYGYADLRVLLLRSVTAVPLHALAAGTMGYYVGLEKLAQLDARAGKKPAREAAGWGQGLAWAVLVHGLYDFFLMRGGLYSFLVIPVLFVGFRSLSKLYRRALELDAQREKTSYQDRDAPIL